MSTPRGDVDAALAGLQARWGAAAPRVVGALAIAALPDDVPDQQPRYEPQAASAFFYDGAEMRAPVAGTVARGELRDDGPYWTGKDSSGAFVTAVPAMPEISADSELAATDPDAGDTNVSLDFDYYLDDTFSVGAGYGSASDDFTLRAQKFFTPSFAVGGRVSTGDDGDGFGASVTWRF